MNEPRRLREVGADDVRQLLLQGKPTRAITPAERARTAARVLGKAVPVSLTLLITSKSLAVALAVGLGAAALGGAPFVHRLVELPWQHPARPSSVPPAAAKTAPVLETPAATTTATPAAEPVPEATATVSARPPVPPTPARLAEPEEDALAREALLLERARAALKSSPARALSLTSEHARSFPKGKLTLERELVAIEALQRSGQRTAARARADRLLRQGAGGIYEARIRRLLER